MKKTNKIVFLYSHPIQYVTPLFKKFQEDGTCSTQAFYCSDKSLYSYRDQQFGINVKWDIPLLDGYKYKFLKNYSNRDSGFFSLMNFGILKELWCAPRGTYIWVHGWNYFTHLATIIFGKILGHRILLHAESPISHELIRSEFQKKVRRIVFKRLLFPFIHTFCHIGKQNKEFYKFYGVKDSDLCFTPYAVDNARFQDQAQSYQGKESILKEELNIPLGKRIFLFSGKYIQKKRPLDLLKAFHQANLNDSFLIMMGEGQLRGRMEEYISKNNLNNVLLTGFINQNNVAKYYAIANVFVMCSEQGETWGLSTNEAMNFKLPIIISDLTGSSSDLVKVGINGYIFPTGDIQSLTGAILQLGNLPEADLFKMGEASFQIIQQYSYDTITRNIHERIAASYN